ncbi:DUF1501 domain-containing protein [Telmatocola sphagniphila]|uniref:DUF1501 domain-containing protein n=2 Tax=Telmatocola sphagniphila TaxID=1123043 RepID=A0A8E6BAX3_9BACT|nr:DUF1501 domain-containing protein [Telmatocola sphagniphila]
MLRQSGIGLGMLGLGGLLANETTLSAAEKAANPLAPKSPHFKPKAKRIIHLFMGGGPSQVDTFDPKPALEKYHGQQPSGAGLKTERKTGGLYKSPFKFYKSGKSGIEVSEIFPEIAKQIDDICVVRSMHTDIPNHEPGLLLMTCGNTQPIRPSMGSWLLYGLGSENQNLPGFVVLCPGKPVVGPALWNNSFLPGIYQGCHIQNLDPKKVIDHIQNRYLTSGTQRQQLDLINGLNKLHLERHPGDEQLDSRIQSLEMAFRMQTEATDVFDVTKEPAKIREEYGTGYFADACLAARRLVERGVRMVQVFYGAGQPWDDHSDIEKGHRAKAKDSDKAIAALLRDLKRKGLLEDTLVLWGGEFGRTPTSEGSSGRDHNNHGFSVWMAGGGVKGGLAYGATDEFGFAAVENKVHIHDLHATMLHLMGLDHEKLTYRYSGRDFRLTDVAGVVVKDILA